MVIIISSKYKILNIYIYIIYHQYSCFSDGSWNCNCILWMVISPHSYDGLEVRKSFSFRVLWLCWNWVSCRAWLRPAISCLELWVIRELHDLTLKETDWPGHLRTLEYESKLVSLNDHFGFSFVICAKLEWDISLSPRIKTKGPLLGLFFLGFSST